MLSQPKKRCFSLQTTETERGFFSPEKNDIEVGPFLQIKKIEVFPNSSLAEKNKFFLEPQKNSDNFINTLSQPKKRSFSPQTDKTEKRPFSSGKNIENGLFSQTYNDTGSPPRKNSLRISKTVVSSITSYKKQIDSKTDFIKNISAVGAAPYSSTTHTGRSFSETSKILEIPKQGLNIPMTGIIPVATNASQASRVAVARATHIWNCPKKSTSEVRSLTNSVLKHKRTLWKKVHFGNLKDSQTLTIVQGNHLMNRFWRKNQGKVFIFFKSRFLLDWTCFVNMDTCETFALWLETCENSTDVPIKIPVFKVETDFDVDITVAHGEPNVTLEKQAFFDKQDIENSWEKPILLEKSLLIASDDNLYPLDFHPMTHDSIFLRPITKGAVWNIPFQTKRTCVNSKVTDNHILYIAGQVKRKHLPGYILTSVFSLETPSVRELLKQPAIGVIKLQTPMIFSRNAGTHGSNPSPQKQVLISFNTGGYRGRVHNSPQGEFKLPYISKFHMLHQIFPRKIIRTGVYPFKTAFKQKGGNTPVIYQTCPTEKRVITQSKAIEETQFKLPPKHQPCTLCDSPHHPYSLCHLQFPPIPEKTELHLKNQALCVSSPQIHWPENTDFGTALTRIKKIGCEFQEKLQIPPVQETCYVDFYKHIGYWYAIGASSTELLKLLHGHPAYIHSPIIPTHITRNVKETEEVKKYRLTDLTKGLKKGIYTKIPKQACTVISPTRILDTITKQRRIFMAEFLNSHVQSESYTQDSVNSPVKHFWKNAPMFTIDISSFFSILSIAEKDKGLVTFEDWDVADT